MPNSACHNTKLQPPPRARGRVVNERSCCAESVERKQHEEAVTQLEEAEKAKEENVETEAIVAAEEARKAIEEAHKLRKKLWKRKNWRK